MEHLNPELVNVIVAVVSFLIGLFTKKPKNRK